MPQRRESEVQAAVLGVFRAFGILCWKQNREKGGWRRASHVGFAGLPDIAGVLPGGRAFFCEVKRRGGILSSMQIGAVDMLRKAGAYVCVVHSVGEAEVCAREALRRLR